MTAARWLRYPAALLLLLSTWGWLELLRNVAVPGPRLADTLPLYETSLRSGLPLGTFLGAWMTFVLLASLLFRPRKPTAAAVLFGLAILAVTLVLEGIQLQMTRQGLFGVDLAGAIQTPPPWIAAVVGVLVCVAIWRPVGEARKRRETPVVRRSTSWSHRLEESDTPVSAGSLGARS